MRLTLVQRLIVIGALAALAVAFLAVKTWNIGGFDRGEEGTVLGLRLGLDLEGGVQLVYQAQQETVTQEQMEGVATIIERRINSFGVAEPNIQVLGTNRLLIQLPGVTEVNEAKRLIGQTATLEFKERECQNPDCTQFIDKDIGLTGDLLSRAFPGRDTVTGRPIVHIEFDARGEQIFAEATNRIAGTNNRVAIFLDEEELLAPVAEQAILGGRAFIQSPTFTSERVRTIGIQLESGRLPVPIEVIQEQEVDATLGQDSLANSLKAGYIGLGLVALFMVLYYRLPGATAAAALMVYVAITLALFKLIPVTLTLAGVAGFILSIGMAVDANVLIFERMKEELRQGRSLVAALDAGFARAWPSIRDSNISTFITCGILYWFGNRLGASVVSGFAVTLFLGVVLSMFSAIFVSRTFLRVVVRSSASHQAGLFKVGFFHARKEAATTPAGRR
ncbi:MAG: protein translocase subunit SecD [Dehalococcoidia bacterium]|nr:protein translocase subunit SecD [Dehalococcoidia bacterium]